MNAQSIHSLVQTFIETLNQQGKSQFTTVAYKKDLEQFVGHLVGKQVTDMKEVEKTHIESFINKLISDGYTKKSASRKLNSIRTFFRFLKKTDYIESNPSSEISHPKFEQAPPRILSKLEYRALRDIAKEDTRTYALVEVLLQTGIKIGELSELRIEDMKENELHIRPYGKNIERDVPLNKAAKRALTEYLKVRKTPAASTDEYIFITRTGQQLLIRNIRQIIDRCFREVEIKDATVNDLRNTFIAHQLMNGASLEYIARIVGHRRLSSTERFLNLVKEEAERKEKLGEL